MYDCNQRFKLNMWKVEEMSEHTWQSVLDEIELNVTRGSFITWFKNTTLLQLSEDVATVGVANVFAKQQLESKFQDLVLDTLKNNGVSVGKVVFTIDSSAMKKNTEEAVAAPVATKTKTAQVNGVSASTGLNSRYRFSNFIVGSGNELAYAACQAVAEEPGTKYNPLFIYGGVGLGKTHLVQAVGSEVVTKNPKAKVAYVTSESFLSEFVESIRKKRGNFADKYRKVDVLIIDDIQFVSGKEGMQEELFHTFNALHQANKQIILSSDRPPKAIATLEERLRSRFEWGMTIDIQAPDFETRCAILQTKSQYRGFDLPQDTIEFLATHVQSNIRELEGALNQLLAFCEMRGVQPDTQLAMGLLSSSRVRPRHITPKQVIEHTAKHFDLETTVICGPKRDKDIVVPRQIAMYLLRSELHLSFPKVARELGRKDHTTAIHSVEKIEKSMAFDHVIRQHVNTIKETLYA